MANSWFTAQEIQNNYNIIRRDYNYDTTKQTIELANSLSNYFKTQRLTPNELTQLRQDLQNGNSLEENFKISLREAFAEGLLANNNTDRDEDAYLGTISQVVFKWIRESFFGENIVDSIPHLLTDSSKEKGIDYFEIIGNANDVDSLYFIVWEIKGTDQEVSSRTNEIYEQHKGRSRRLIRGLQTQLTDQYQREGRPMLSTFASHLMDYWLDDSPKKKLGGSIVHGMVNQPNIAFSTFQEHFPNLPDSSCRQVCLVQIPSFETLRKQVWDFIWLGGILHG